MSGVRKSRKMPIVGAIALAAILAFAWFAWRGPSKPTEVPAETTTIASDGSLTLSERQMRSQGIESAAVSPAAVVPLPDLPARTAPPLEATAQAIVPYAGVVTRILVDEGASVRRGEPMVRIQSRELLMAQADLTRARSEATTATLQARRDAALLAEGIIPAARNEQSRARATAAEGERRRAEGALGQLRIDGGSPGEYALLAPMDGRVLRRTIQPGQAVAAQDAAFTIAAPGPLDLHFSVPLRESAALAPGLRVRLPNGGAAEVVAISADVDASDQRARVRARLASEAGYLPGQQFGVTLELPAPAGAWAVPTAALLPVGDGHALYRIDGRRVRAVPVQQLLGGDDRISVVRARGLDAKARVVVRGTTMLKSLLPAQGDAATVQ
ncbi:MAG: efflux RND transporter periplasmic adaptor subunit [Lysobacter sp.]|nr:efflux RND transporter periplasmic adaptor subunit [Lysobacter sp.]